MYNCRDCFWDPLSESTQFRGSIRRPVIKVHGFQCIPGIDGGVEQHLLKFHFACIFWAHYVLFLYALSL